VDSDIFDIHWFKAVRGHNAADGVCFELQDFAPNLKITMATMVAIQVPFYSETQNF
jgi:hypothetical protein